MACVGVALALGTVASSASSPLSFARASYIAGESPVEVAVRDLNGDGKPDLATADEDEDSVAVLLNRGDGRFRVRRTFATDEGPESLAVGDLNGDGKADLVTENDTSVSVLLNNGDGSFRQKVDYPLKGNGLGSVAIGDLDADGKADLAVVKGPEETVSVLLNRGDGSYLPGVDYATGKTPKSVAIGDLNGDDKADLATANVSVKEQNTVSVLVNKGDGSFLARHDYPTGRETLSVAIGDLNGDRTPDLATANWYHTVSVLLNRGDGSFQAPLNYPSGLRPQSLATGDLNGDGKLDLVTANTGEVNVLLNATGLCAVPHVKGKAFALARRAIARGGCRVGTVRRVHSTTVRGNRVIAQKPPASSVLPRNGAVNLVVSLGPKH